MGCQNNEPCFTCSLDVSRVCTLWLPRMQVLTCLYFVSAVWYVLDIYKPTGDHREDKILDALFEHVMELDRLMEGGYRGAKNNINILQYVYL